MRYKRSVNIFFCNKTIWFFLNELQLQQEKIRQGGGDTSGDFVYSMTVETHCQQGVQFYHGTRRRGMDVYKKGDLTVNALFKSKSSAELI